MNIDNLSYVGYLPKKEEALRNIEKLPERTLEPAQAKASIRDRDENQICLYPDQEFFKLIRVPEEATEVHYNRKDDTINFTYKETRYSIHPR